MKSKDTLTNMKKTAQLALLFAAILMAHSASATTYYIDYANGSDSNSGTSKAATWQHAPGMQGCVANCANYLKVGGAGDQIILKGCVTWPNSVMPWSWYANDGYPSGTAANPVYIGVDKTWWDSTVAGCSSGWNRPVFNLGATALSDPANQIFNFGGTSYVTLDNFEVIGVLCTKGTFGETVVFAYGTSTNLDIKNMFVHGWSSSPTTVITTGTIHSGSAVLTLTTSSSKLAETGSGLFVGEPIQILPAGSVLPVINNGPIIVAISGSFVTVNAAAQSNQCESTPCTIEAGYDYCQIVNGMSGGGNAGSIFEEGAIDGYDTPEVQGDPNCTSSCVASAIGVYHGPPIIRNNVFRYLSNGLVMDAQEGSGNLVEYLRQSTNPSAHTNGWEENSDSPLGLLFFNNVIRHLNNPTAQTSIGVPVWITPRSDAKHPTYVFNNLIYDGIQNGPLELAKPLATPDGGTVIIFNNTMDCGPEWSLTFVCTGCSSSYVGCVIENNHFITTNATPINNCSSNCSQSHNLAQTPAAASAQGYSVNEAYVYSPTSGGGATIGKGADMNAVCAAIAAINANAGQACQSDTAYAVNYSAESCSTLACWQAAPHTVVVPDRVASLRPPSTPDIGAYQFSGSSAPAAPTGLSAIVE